MHKFLILLYSILAIGCAGPSTPFGAISSLLPDSRSDNIKNSDRSPALTAKATTSQIEFLPKRQVLHKNEAFKVKLNNVYSSTPKDHIKIKYNGIDVTKKAMSTALIKKTFTGYEIEMPSLSLPDNRYNNIEVSYKEPNNLPFSATYHPPVCDIFSNGSIVNTAPFSPPEYYIHLIKAYAPKASFNPSLIAGVIAQESGFNPNAVSWAKAIGLTQMTPIAEKQILPQLNHYPQHPGINDYSYLRLKTLINSGKIDQSHEWRLNPSYSIQGGIVFLKYIDGYWRKPQNAKILESLPGNPNVIYSQVLLASYNSGPARVKFAIKRKGSSWLLDKKMNEAHRYVNRIFSYCYHFSTAEVVKEYVDAS